MLQRSKRMTLQTPIEGFANFRISERTRIVLALAEFRKEWQEAVNDGSLLKVESPVGLVLADIVDRLELTSQERYAVLGGKKKNKFHPPRDKQIGKKLLLYQKVLGGVIPA